MKDPVLDRSRPYSEVHDAFGSVRLEQDGNIFNMNGDLLTIAVPPSDVAQVTHYEHQEAPSDEQAPDHPDEPHAAHKRRRTR